MLLSDAACRNALPKDKDYKLSDGEGMYLLVKKSGRRYWRMNYRFGGKSKTYSIGVYPDVSLKMAREKRVEARRLLADGIDPSAQKQVMKLEREANSGDSFAGVYRDWFEKKRDEWSSNTIKKISSICERDLLPFLGNSPINDVTPLMLLGVLRKIEARGALETADDAKGYAGQIFRFGIATGRAERDISADLKGALKKRKVSHHAYLSERDLPEFLQLLDGHCENIQSIEALNLCILTMVRTTEVRWSVWSEIDFDAAEWRIPAERMKMEREHIVPLSRQAMSIFTRLKASSSPEFEYIFPNSQGKRKPMSENAMLYCLYRLGYKGRTTVHGFRSSASTILNESGLFRPDVIERQLAHVDSNSVRASYNRAQYLDERREMMQWWADHLDELRLRT